MTESADHKIHKITTDASLSMEMLSIIKSIVLLNHKINLEKYEHPCQVESYSDEHIL
jgi:hypothetical protein